MSETKSVVINVRLSPSLFDRLTERAAAERRPVRQLAAVLIEDGLNAPSFEGLHGAAWPGPAYPALGDAPSDVGLEERPAAPADEAVLPRRVVATVAYVPPDSPVGRLLATARSAAEAEGGRPAMPADDDVASAEAALRSFVGPVPSDAEGRRLARQSARGEDFVGGLDAAREKSVAGYAREVERVEAKSLVASVLPVAGTAFPKKDALKRSGKGK